MNNTILFALIIAGVILGLFSLNNAEKSTVTKFYYGGYGDTTVAYLGGKVYERCRLKNCKVKLHPLKDVIIHYRDGGLLGKTDSAGYFGFFFGGNRFYSLDFSKPRYQSLIVNNYFADQDQGSSIEIILELGEGANQYELPKHER